ncbi:MAG: YitT family protein [Chloroflexaceae bacterium]|nr:YitT family protein [Chloroflexaceae bacterium]NJO05417.1 YitT family protein [Chloroflexaceae bacterium]
MDSASLQAGIGLQVRSKGDIWRITQRFLLVVIGTLIAALSYVLFQVPFDLAAGGITGLNIIINHFMGWPLGVLYFVTSLPLLLLGYYYLGGWRFLTFTLTSVIVFSIATDVLHYALPLVLDTFPVTDDVLLSSIYAAIIGGIGNGLIFRAGGSRGGTSVIGRIIQEKTGIPLSQVYLLTDGGIVMLAGLLFGWEVALHAMLILFLNGIASDFVMEGPSTVRTATIVTNHPTLITTALMHGLHRGSSYWQATGAYTGEPRALVFCTIYRSQVHELKQLIALSDPQAFVVIGNAHQALGSSFIPLATQRNNAPRV